MLLFLFLRMQTLLFTNQVYASSLSKPLFLRSKKKIKILGIFNNGAADGTRTRDPRRDRPVF